MFTNFKNYLLQDISRRFNNNDFLHCLLRYYRIPAFKILINYRLGQYISKNGGRGKLLVVSRFLMERLCSRYNVLIDYKLQAGPGLYFPHNGPFIINGNAIIGENCTIHPNVLIGGDRGKGTPTIGDNVFIGNGVKIIGNCHIGNWVFISPGAMVTKDVPDESVVGYGFNNIISRDGMKHVQKYL